MATTHTTSSPTTSVYTAKLVDGPLEGKTLRRSYDGATTPAARLEIPGPRAGSHYIYLFSGALEHDEGAGTLPTAAAYRYQRLSSD
ncbi:MULTISPECIES: hypothetical protein [unclassified Rathayibacter]|uniref:hypothetical protein n=1 Tax=unclassified Rathayibacter TaxID=2609250 RepID=UPI0006FCFA3D|nr:MULTISPECIES: hypothetical protein [unclassified Rathayibacter]KQQ03923.1 hypothetical protein ASF42_10755 [Rathayibacter sp. Leaf294]KQS12712.1 hypothetical protein ASG06_10755 [Rathayibacter sp. Leaf185]